MIKEAGIFVISAAFLVYFIAPVEKEQTPSPVKIETKQKAVSSANANADYWGGDEYGENDNEQEFVFGEPMISTEPISETDHSSDGEQGNGSGEGREVRPSPASASSGTANSQRVHSSSPKSGEPGSAQNPIVLN